MLHRLLSVSVSCLKDKASITDGIHASILFEEGSGIRVISAKHPKDNYFELSLCEEISAIQHTQNPRTALRVGDVILSTVGTIGNVAVVDPSMLPANSDRHVGIIRPNGGMPPEFISTFLLSRYGRFQTRRETTGNVQPNLFISKISELIIPIFSNDFMHSIQTIVCSASECRRRSELRTLDAQQILLHALGLGGWQPSEPLTYTRRASEAFAAGRLDAEHWAPKFDALLSLIKEKGAVSLGDAVTERVRRGISPEYVEDGDILVINSQHVGKTHVILDDNRKTLRSLANLDGNESRTGIVRKGDVLLNSTGVITIGRSQCVLEDMVAVADNHIAIIRPNKSIDPVYLACFLNSQPGMMQTERGYSGSSGQIELRPEVVEDFLIWLAPQEIQDAVKQSVEMAHRARKESRLLLERAKRAVEIAIEQNEAAALEYLNTISD